MAALEHPQILDTLNQAFEKKVYLLCRLVEPSLSLGGDASAHVFIPDTHIVSDDDVKRWPGRVMTPSRQRVLALLLDAMDSLRAADPNLTVWQLGDLIDLWRIGEKEGLSLKTRITMATDNWGDVLGRFERKAALGIRRLFGNHDEGLRGTPGVEEHAFLPPDPGDHASNDMLVTHGHRLDPLEDLPEFIKAGFMRAGTQRVTPFTNDIITVANPHWMPQADFSFTPPGKPGSPGGYLCAGLKPGNRVPLDSPRWNVDEVTLGWRPDANPFELASNGGSKWIDDAHPPLWDRAKQQAAAASGSGYKVALVVVGHTHDPRIILGRQPDGQGVVLMDCGGWIGPRYLAPGFPGPIHACHVGVRVGSDLRIYQLGNDPYRWPR